MAKTYGYGLQAFAGGFQTGLGLGMENKKIKMLQEEQKRAEKLAKEKEENAMNWLNTNKDSLMNFHTQPQDTRNMLIFESTQYKKEWTDYLRDVEDFLQSGDLEGLKSLNDMEEERIKAERDMLGLGIRPENAFVGKYYSEKDMEYVKKLQMGKLPIKPIGMKMYEEEFGKLPPEEPTMADEKSAINLLRSFIRATPEQYEKQRTNLEQRTGLDLSMYTQEILREEGSEFFNLYDTPEEVIASVKAPAGLTVIPKRDTKTGKYYGSFSKETVPTPKPTLAPISIENTRKAMAEADIVEDARRIYKNYADKYDETALGIPEGDIDRFWAESQIPYLDNIKTAIGNLTDEKGWLKKGTITGAEIGLEGEGERPVEEFYKKLKEEYTRYRDMLEKMGIDISQFLKLKSLEEIEKVGLGEGFWGIGKQKGQYKSIYY